MATTLNIGGKKVKVDDSFNDLDAAGQKKVIRRIERDLGVSSSKPAKQERGTGLKDVARFGLGQGLALGFGDEIEAGVTSLFGDETYDEAVGRIRADMDDYRRDNAGKALAMELGGGLLTGGYCAGRAALAAGARGAIKAGAKAGAGVGGVAGFGSGEGLEGSLTGAAIGAGAGGALGAALPAAGNLVKGTVNRVRSATDMIADKGAQKASDLKILQAMEAEGMSPTQAYRKLAQAKRGGVEDTMLVDVMNESGRGLAQGANTVSTKARTIAEEALDNRQMKSGKQIADDLADNVVSGKTAEEVFDGLVQQNKTMSKPAYDKAYMAEDGTERLVQSDAVERYLKSDDFVDAFQRGKRLFERERLTDDSLADVNFSNLFVKNKDGNLVRSDAIPTVRQLDYIKRGLDDKVGTAFQSGIGGQEKKALTDIIRNFRDAIDDEVPAYAQARKQFGDRQSVFDAVEKGRKIFSTKEEFSVPSLRRAVKDMNETEKDAFRAGVAEAVKNKGTKSDDLKNNAKFLFGNEDYRNLLKLTFDTNTEAGAKAWQAFSSRMEQRMNQAVTRARTKPSAGSRTPVMTEDGRDIQRDAGLLMNLLSGNISGVSSDLVTRGGGLGKRIGTNVSGDLFDTNLASQKETLRRLNQLRASEKARLERSGITASKLGGGIGASTGLLTN